MFTYSGWNAAAYVAEEVRSPARNVPIALGLGTLVVIAIYVGLNILYLYALPVAELSKVSGTLIDSVAERLVGFVAGTLIGAVAAVFVLRHREPDVARPFRAWGYPWAPGLFVTVSTIVVANEIWRNPLPSAAGLAIIGAGIPVYRWMKRAGASRLRQ